MKVKDFRFHDFKRAFVTRMRRAGVHDRVIMAITGHKTGEMFKQYDTLDDNDIHKAILAYDAAQTGQEAANGTSEAGVTTRVAVDTKGATNIEQLIHDHAEGMAEQMNQIAQWAKSEEDVRYECNKLIDDFLKKAGIKVKGRHEYGLAGGRIDSKYGGVIIEYKDPSGTGKITEDANAPGTKAVVKQIKKRFKDFQAEEHVEKERIFGVGCDGDTLIFIRHRGKNFEIDDPQPTTRHTVERLLRALVSLGAQGYSFTPDHLSGHFGADSPLAQNGINSISKLRGIVKLKNSANTTLFIRRVLLNYYFPFIPITPYL